MFTVERNNIGKTRLIFDLSNSSWLIIVWVCVGKSVPFTYLLVLQGEKFSLSVLSRNAVPVCQWCRTHEAKV